MAGNVRGNPADGFQEENVIRLPLDVSPESRYGSFVTKDTGDNQDSAFQDAIIRNGYIEQLDQTRSRVLLRPGRKIYSELDRARTAGDSHEFLFGIHYYKGRDLRDTVTPTLAVVSRGDLYINPIESASTGEKWKQLPNAPWAASSGAFPNEAQFISNSTNLTTFAIISGRGGDRQVYSTTDQGTTWTLLTSSPGWVARAGFRVIRRSSTYYLMGGRNAAGTLLNDVWTSTDGITWTQATAAAGWSAREYFSIAALTSTIAVAGGDSGSLEDDVWTSTDGASWTQQTAAAGWAARKNAGLVGSSTNLYIAGGEISSGNAFDFWISTDSGATWLRQTDKMPISARTLSISTGSHTVITPEYNRAVLTSRLVATNGSTGLAFTALNEPGVWWQYTADSAVQPAHGQFVETNISGGTTGHLTVGVGITILWLGQVSPYYEQAYTDIFQLGGGEDEDDDSTFKIYFEENPRPDLVQKIQEDGSTINRTTANPPLEGFMLNSNREAYFYNTRARALAQITSPNYPATTVGGMAWLNGRFYIMTPEGRIYASGINDPFTWDALDFINAIMHPDTGIGLFRHHTYITAFGHTSTETFYDSGSAVGNPLRRVDSAPQNFGCVDAATIVRMGNTTFFVGSSENTREYGVYALEGYVPRKVSPVYVDKALAVGDFNGMHALGLFINGHRFYVVTGTCGGIGTWVYDLDTQRWFNWFLAIKDGFFSTGDGISAALDASSGLVKVTVTDPNFFNETVVGEPVKIEGLDQSEYNVETVVHESLDPDTFDFTYILPTSTVPTTPGTGNMLVTIYPQFSSDGQADNPGYYKWTSFDSASLPSQATWPPNHELVVDEADGNVYRVTHAATSDRDGLIRAIALGSNSLGDPADRTFIDFTIRTPRVDFNNNLRKFIGRCEVVGGLSDTKALVRYSDDDYKTWSPYRLIDMSTERPRISRQGNTRRRAYEFRQVFEFSQANGQEVYSVEALEIFYKQGLNV